jgi:hypothetical protein
MLAFRNPLVAALLAVLLLTDPVNLALGQSLPAVDPAATVDQDVVSPPEGTVDPAESRAALQAAIAGVAEEQLYNLAYRWSEGTELVWDCDQSTSTRTRMGGTTEATSARTSWQCTWVTGPADSAGNLRFSSSVDWFTLWQKYDEQAPVTFDSRTSSDVPDEFVSVGDQLTPKPTQFVISPQGRLIRQESGTGAKAAGLSDITIPLPSRPVPAGTSWHVPRELTVRDDDRTAVRVALRTTWQLSRVVEDRAYLTFRTETLTPGLSAAIQSQLMQNMSRGYVIFDLQRGLPVYRETEWNEKVQSFAGAESFLQYTAKVTERLRPDERVAAVPSPGATAIPEATTTAAGPLTPQVEPDGKSDDNRKK